MRCPPSEDYLEETRHGRMSLLLPPDPTIGRIFKIYQSKRIYKLDTATEQNYLLLSGNNQLVKSFFHLPYLCKQIKILGQKSAGQHSLSYG